VTIPGDGRTPVGAAPGAVLFARYAYPPNALGYCGPADPDGLLGAATMGEDRRELASLAAQFEGAWPYLQLIAAATGVEDPLDHRVVTAYWLGNPLLEVIPPSVLLHSLDERFERRAREDFASIASAVLAGGVAHHSFHVFAIYPWLGLLRRGMDGAPLTVMDRCRIRPGKVVAVLGENALVRSRGLTFRGGRLLIGEERLELASWSRQGMALSGPLEPGDSVSLHWDWICDRLSPEAERRLIRVTGRNLRAVNCCARPGPAVACGA
jgi:hypothetical protein